MDRRLLQHYNTELQHLRSTAAEFAREFPKIAGRLALDRDSKESCPDPFVERLLEGVAFLSARVQVKLDAEFPRFTQSLLETVYPHYLSPTPSMAVVRFEPDPQASQLVEGYPIPRGTRLTSAVGRGERTSCEYRTAHDVRLWPIELVEAQYYTRDVGQLELPREFGAKAAIRLRLKILGGAIDFRALALDQLNFYIRGADETPVSIYEQIFGRASWCKLPKEESSGRASVSTNPQFAGLDSAIRRACCRMVPGASRATGCCVSILPFRNAFCSSNSAA